MSKNKIWIGIILSIILLLFSVNGFTSYYKYTQESGTNFFVGTADKADALEDSNEVRQILDDLGNLLGHSKRDNLYPKDGTTGGYLGRLNYGLDASKPAVPVVNDIYLATDTVKVYRCFVAGNWVQVYPITEVDPTVDTDAEIKAILVDEVTKTGTFTAGKIVKINNATGIIEQGTNTDTDVADAVTKKHSQNTDTDLDTTFEATFVKKVDTINVLSDITSPGTDIEDAVTKRHSKNADTALGTQTQDLNMGTHKIIGMVDPVNPQEAATKAYADTKLATEVDPTVDTDAEIKAILVDEVTKTGTLTVGNLTKTNNATGVIEDASVAIETALTTGSNAKVPTSKAVNDFCETTKDYMQELEDDPNPYLGGILRLNEKSIYINAWLTSDHTFSGLLDYQVVGESVAFGDLLYFNWTTKKWKKTDADAATTMPGLRIAVEPAEADQSCNMLVKGYIRDDTWNFTGAMIYASTTAGGVTSTAPSAAGQQLQRVGIGGSANVILFFDPSIDVGEI